MQNKKVDRIKFVTEVKELLLQKGFKENTKNAYEYIFIGSKNEVYLNLYEQKDHEIMYSIFSRFKDCTTLSGRINSKYNFHKSTNNWFNVEDIIFVATDYIDDLVEACNQEPIERVKSFFAGQLLK